MGVVYRLHALESDEENLAIKIVHPLLNHMADAEAQLKHEAEIEMGLQDLNCVVKTLSYGAHVKGHGYKIMKVMPGGSLKGWLRRNPAKFDTIQIPQPKSFRQIFASFAKSFALADLKLRLALISPIFKKIIEAVEDIHAQGVVHGDLKPSNIYFTEELSSFKLFDFGLARRNKKRFKATFKAYTPYYASTAMLEGKMPQEEDDWYSVCLHFLGNAFW